MAAVESSSPGLRDRQKSRRRRDILAAARRLIEAEGYAATTMAKIAEAADVSAPTVFNYFGSKDQLVVAMVLEAHEAGQEYMKSWTPPEEAGLGEILGEIFCIYADLTMSYAGKRVWRYAEATNIRCPDSPMVQLYAQIEKTHHDDIAKILHRLAGRHGLSRSRSALLARVAYSVWNARFLDFIRDEAMSLEAHKTQLCGDMHELGAMVAA
ncbi:helix-turn-helix domain-containing protein [Roseovarius sp. C7]|uniref:TetR/AcrR family transcriptional regulator n=1 Tax=Roseovarius sp. C7 TaxID=3398643 RepID=UPI0039F64C64